MSLIAEALKKAGHSQRPGHRVQKALPAALWGWSVAVAVILGLAWILSRPDLAQEPLPLPPSVPEVAPADEAKRPPAVELIMEAQNQWRLNGIIRSSDGKALALINGHLMEEGGTFKGMRLVRIRHEEVEIEEPDGNRSFLTLP